MRHSLKSLLLTIIVACVSQSACWGQSIVNSFADNLPGDILLMYYGQKGRLKWNVDQVSSAVTHTFADGHTEWLFPTYLYLEFRRGNQMLGNGHPIAKIPAVKEDWQWLLDRFFAANEGLDALDKAIEEAKRQYGPPPFQHQVIMMIPVPVSNQGAWGQVGNKTLSFTRDSDKLSAIQWYIDALERRFNQQNYKNIKLMGYYWLDEYTKPSESYISRVGDYIHQKGRKFFWIPMSNGYGRFSWKQYNIDYAYLQLGYFWNLKKTTQSMINQIASAKKYGLGMEFEINEKIASDDHDKYLKRMTELIDCYEQQGVFSESGIAYYFSERALIQIKNSSRKDDIAVMDRLARLIVNRNKWLQHNTPAKASEPSAPSQHVNQNKNNDKSTLDWRDPEYWHF